MLEPQPRKRRIEPIDRHGEPVCLLTADAARTRRVPIDRLLQDGDLILGGTGYEIRLPRGERYWTLANQFAEEEAACCRWLQLDVEESATGTTVRAAQ